jgi:hypothetical protein
MLSPNNTSAAKQPSQPTTPTRVFGGGSASFGFGGSSGVEPVPQIRSPVMPRKSLFAPRQGGGEGGAAAAAASSVQTSAAMATANTSTGAAGGVKKASLSSSAVAAAAPLPRRHWTVGIRSRLEVPRVVAKVRH